MIGQAINNLSPEDKEAISGIFNQKYYQTYLKGEK
jgi:hypothetical protein